MFVEAGGLEAPPEPDLDAKGQEPTEPDGTKEPDGQEPKAPEPKMFDEKYVKSLRAENAKYRVQAREAEAKLQPQVDQYGRLIDPYSGMPIPPAGQNLSNIGQNLPNTPQQEPVYDPRVDDMLLDNKLNAIKAEPYFEELFKDTDEEGRTFEERLLEKAVELSWPVAELDALAFKMEKEKLLGGVKQKGVDEAYESMKNKAQGSPDKNVSSGKNVEPGEVNSVRDAIALVKKEEGITDLTNLG